MVARSAFLEAEQSIILHPLQYSTLPIRFLFHTYGGNRLLPLAILTPSPNALLFWEPGGGRDSRLATCSTC